MLRCIRSVEKRLARLGALIERHVSQVDAGCVCATGEVGTGLS